mmetsp:Transcript_45750/g.89405  ORF Transcript_45750/g.89405 Transcript_45750/m.89405 type:complete len:313 (+) Transcript_45750:156-1094(+)
MNMPITVGIISILLIGGAPPSVSFRPPVSTTSSTRTRTLPPRTPVKLSPNDLLPDPSYLGGSFLWTLNFYYGFDWLLAPLGTGLDSDFNPAYRTATFFGSILAGSSPGDALSDSNGPITGEDGDRPEMGSRIGSGANAGYATSVGDGGAGDSDWLSDRRAGLRSPAPFLLRVAVAVAYGVIGSAAMAAVDSVQTAAVLVIPALVYEIGRPSLPTREEAVADAALDGAVAAFAGERVLLYGQENLPDGAAPVRRDEATNERRLVAVFRKELLQKNDFPPEIQDVSDFQIEMKFREMGTGRSEAGFIKGVRLLP